MRHLFDPEAAGEIKERLARLRPDAERKWGRMNLAQMLAHCTAALEMATGDRILRRTLIGRILGRLVKSRVLADDRPFSRNAPTDKGLKPGEAPDLDEERRRLSGLIDRFVAGGPARCSTHPHPFFGPLNAQEWGVLAYKHLDHHLRQFGA